VFSDHPDPIEKKGALFGRLFGKEFIGMPSRHLYNKNRHKCADFCYLGMYDSCAGETKGVSSFGEIATPV